MTLSRWESGGRLGPGYPVVVSYFTNDFYKRDAFQLARTCLSVGLPYSIEQVPDLGSWEKNTSFKPKFLQRKSAEFPSQALLWLDADARVWKVPTLLNGLEATLAYHTWKGREALSGTVYLGSLDRERDRFLARWVSECESYPDLNDQACMKRALGGVIDPFDLPESYCSIFDGVGQDRDPSTQAPVIEHFQSSRFTRRGR